MAVDPHGLLAHVHPDLVKVIVGARQTQPFEVIQGLRTLAQEKTNVARGASQTLHSRHLPDAHFGGVAMAVDVAALVDDHVSWEAALYQAIGAEVKASAARLDIPITWGGQWRTLKDLGHFELAWSAYP